MQTKTPFASRFAAATFALAFSLVMIGNTVSVPARAATPAVTTLYVGVVA